MLGSLGVGLLGLTTQFVPAGLILVVIGAATLSFIGSSNILLQTLSPDDMRGRALSVYGMILLGLVPLGSLLIGAVASLFDLRWTFVGAGALAVVVALWIALTKPDVRAA